MFTDVKSLYCGVKRLGYSRSNSLDQSPVHCNLVVPLNTRYSKHNRAKKDVFERTFNKIAELNDDDKS